MKTTSESGTRGHRRVFAVAALGVALFAVAPSGAASSVWEEAFVKIDGAVDLNGDGRWTPSESASKQGATSSTAEIPDARHGALAQSDSQVLTYGSSNSGVISRSGVRIVEKKVVKTSCGGATNTQAVLYFPQVANGTGKYSFENVWFKTDAHPLGTGSEWTVVIRCRLENFVGSAVSYVFGVKTTTLGGQKEIRLGWGNNPNNASDTKKYLNVVTGNQRWAFTNIEAKTNNWVEVAMVVHPTTPVNVNGQMTITNCIRFASAYEGETRLWRNYDVPYSHSTATTNFIPLNVFFGGVRYDDVTSNFDAFRGDIQLLGLWPRALSDDEICEAFSEDAPNLFRLGEENCAAEMFGGAAPASGATVTLNPLVNDKRDFPTVLTPGATFRIPFAVDKYATNTAHWVRFKAQSGSAAGTVAVAMDGVALDPLGVSSGHNSYLWVPGAMFTEGDHVLTLSRTDGGAGDVKFDVIELGGALCAGAADRNEDDMASASATASLGYFDYDTWYAADGNLKDFVRATQRSKNGTHRPKTIKWTLPQGAAEKFGMQFSYKFLYSTSDSGGNEPLVFTVNGTQVHVDNNATHTKATTVFKVDADSSPFVDGENTIHIDFAAANKNNWLDWDMLKIEPLRPKSPFVLVVR